MKNSKTTEILLIEDDKIFWEFYKTMLDKSTETPYSLTCCENLKDGINHIQTRDYDVVILDLNLPDSNVADTINGIRWLAERNPLVIITSTDDIQLAKKALSKGAQDFLYKPLINTELLEKTLAFSIERFQMRKELEIQEIENFALLSNILPRPIIRELKSKGKVKAKLHNEATILFTDFVNFTEISKQLTPRQLIKELDRFFIQFDRITTELSVEKIKTSGDSYMCAAGLPEYDADHATKSVQLAYRMMEVVNQFNANRPTNKPAWEIRIGIHSGPVIAGIVGHRKYVYDVWGETVNIASRLESHGEPGTIHISQETKALVDGEFNFQKRGEIQVKGIGAMDTYFVETSPIAAVALP